MLGFERHILQNMACQLSKLIKHNVNIFDINGIIIGSSDEGRLGEYHAFAHKLINSEAKTRKVYHPKSPNVKPGVNLKIFSQEKVIGAVGITGNPDEVEFFSEIIKLLLESLIDHKLHENQYRQIRRFEKQVVLDAVLNLSSNQEIQKKLDVLEFEQKEFIIILKFLDINYDFEKMFDGYQPLFAEMSHTMIVLLAENSIERIELMIKKLETEQSRVIVSRAVNFNTIAQEYKIINYIEQFMLKDSLGVYYTEDYLLDCFFYNVSKANFPFLKFFNGAEELIKNDTLINTFLAYVNNNLSIKNTAGKMYVHQNTIKYRLKCIENITGYNLKNVNDVIKLKISILSLRYKK